MTDAVNAIYSAFSPSDAGAAGLSAPDAVASMGAAGAGVGGTLASSVAPGAAAGSAFDAGALSGFGSAGSGFTPAFAAGGLPETYTPGANVTPVLPGANVTPVLPGATPSSAAAGAYAPASIASTTGAATPGAGSGAVSSAAPSSVGSGGAGHGDFGLSSGSLADSGGVKPTTAFSPGGVGAAPNTNIGGNVAPPPVDKPATGWMDSAKSFLKDYGPMAGVGLSALNLGAAALRGNQTMPGQAQISQTAAQLGAQGKTLQDYLTNGTLPPGVATSLHSAGEAAKATIRSQYAARGMTGSDAEQRDLANVDTGLVSQGASIASNLLSQGVQESGLAAQLYSTIMNAATQQDAALGQAISGFASSLVPSQSVTLKLPGQ